MKTSPGETTIRSVILHTPKNDSRTTPVVISCPHAGIYIPPEIYKNVKVSAQEILLRSEPDTAILTESFAKSSGAAHIQTRLAPGILNVGRPVNALHPDDIRGSISTIKHDKNNSTVKDRYGDGLISYKTLVSRENVYYPGKEPDAAEIQRRIDTYYTPYHDALENLVRGMLRKHGYCLIFDVHSCTSKGLPGQADEGQDRPDIILGNLNSSSCSEELTGKLVKTITAFGFTHALNYPFSGGYITQKYSAQSSDWGLSNCESIQIEFKRSMLGIHDQTAILSCKNKFKKAKTLAQQLMATMSEYAQRQSHQP